MYLKYADFIMPLVTTLKVGDLKSSALTTPRQHGSHGF